MNTNETAQAVNILSDFCGCRDVPVLSRAALLNQYGFDQTDVMVLFGGSILCGGDVLADAMRAGVAKKYAIVGGEGHTTQALRERMHAAFPAIETRNRSEAEVFAAYLKHRYGLISDFLECASTNCGNNITYLLKLLENAGITPRSIILCQDAAMQRRMDAGLRKYVSPDVEIINFAAYTAHVVVKDGVLAYDRNIWGMWDLPRYLTLLMGEIPRLRDDANGYGPRGAGYIAHVDIPEKVLAAFKRLKETAGISIRRADPQFASKDVGAQ